MSANDDNNDPKISSPYFNVNKLKSTTSLGLGDRGIGAYSAMPQNFADGSDLLANQGYVIDFEHVPSGKKLFFKAFIMSYNETFSPDWAEEQVFGRMDPIVQFKNTTRNVSMGLKIPAASESEAFENLSKLQALVQFLYPNYYDVARATTIAQSPLMRLGVMNLGRSQAGDQDPIKYNTAPTPSTAPGMLGYMKNLTLNYNLDSDAGVIQRVINREGAAAGSSNTILPKLIEINFDFAILHEHGLGWEDGKFSEPSFPYGMDYEDSGPRGRDEIVRRLESDQAQVLAQNIEARARNAEEELTTANNADKWGSSATDEDLAIENQIPQQVVDEEEGRLRNVLSNIGSGLKKGLGVTAHALVDVAAATSPVAWLSPSGRNRTSEALSHIRRNDESDPFAGEEGE
jgi:hypothetical protein